MQIAIVLYPGLTALDAVGPYEVLRMLPEADVRFVAREPGPVFTDAGILALGATHAFEEVPTPDVVVVPGSEAQTPTAMADRYLQRWLVRAHETSTWTTSVCSGALILGAAGILEGHPATTHWIAQRRLGAFGGESRPSERVVRSGKLMTAAGVSAGIDMALALVEELAGRERARVIQLLLEYDPRPHLDSGHPDKAPPEVFAVARAEMEERMRTPRNAVSVPIVLWRNGLRRIRRRLG